MAFSCSVAQVMPEVAEYLCVEEYRMPVKLKQLLGKMRGASLDIVKAGSWLLVERFRILVSCKKTYKNLRFFDASMIFNQWFHQTYDLFPREYACSL